MKKYFRVFCIYLFINILATLFFIALFHTPFIFTDVFFYQGVFFIFLATLLSMGLMHYCKVRFKSLNLNHQDTLVEGICFFCITLCYFTVLPVTAERSISVFMIDYMAMHEQEALDPIQFEQIFYDKYIKENKAIFKRFYEQEVTGSIEPYQNGYRITSKGKFLAKLFRSTKELFNTTHAD